ncbi:MAG: hypothetical protein WAO83_22145 [Fuerstiella sp.]
MKTARILQRSLTLWVVVLTIAFEAFTCVMRFAVKMESTRDTASTIGRWTCGLRIHHSYIGGAMMLLACVLWTRYPKLCWWMLAIGMALFFSDMIHHFGVLWPIYGSPQFDLVYPPIS